MSHWQCQWSLRQTASRVRSSLVGYALKRCHATSTSSRLLVAGFPLPLIPEVRRALDEAGPDVYNLDMIVCTHDMLERDLLFVMESTPPINWLAPIPEDWGELNVTPTLLFTNLHPISQADIAEVVRSAANGWPLKFGDCQQYDGFTVGEAIARVATAKPAEEDANDLIVDFIDSEEEEMSDDEDDSYMMAAGDINGTDFSENLFLAIDDLTARAEETNTR